MSTKATGNKKHLTLADRAAIEHGISRGENFTQIISSEPDNFLSYHNLYGFHHLHTKYSCCLLMSI